MTGKQKLRMTYEKKTGEKAILKFKKTKTYIFNDDYTLSLERMIIEMLKKEAK